MLQYRNALASAAALIVASGCARGAVHFVNHSATGLNDGSSWTNAYTDLVDALSAAVPGDEVWVAAGVYTPASSDERTTKFDGSDACIFYGLPSPCNSTLQRTRTFKIEAGIKLLGGFSGTETTAAQRVLDATATKLSGDLNQNDDPTDPTTRSDNVAQTVVIDGGAEEITVVDRLTIDGGTAVLLDPVFEASLGEYGSGGGMIIARGSTELNQVLFANNYAIHSGGALAILSAGSTTISDCTFEKNLTDSSSASDDLIGTGGGAIWHGWNDLNEAVGPLVITDSIFVDNASTATGTGGAINSDRPPAGEAIQTVSVSGSTFSGNTGGGELGCGSNLCQGTSTIEAVSLTLHDSIVEYGIGGTAVRVYHKATITDSVFQNNESLMPSFMALTTDLWPGALDVRGESPFFVTETIISNCDFTNNTGARIGAAYAEGQSVTVTGSKFIDNQAEDGDGGGLYVLDPDALVDRCEFRGNSASDHGGGLYARGSRQVSNCVFVGNASHTGGGIYITQLPATGSAERLFINCTLYGNTATLGGGIYRDADGSGDPEVLITNSIIWGNTDSVGTLSGQIAGAAFPNLTVEYSTLDDPAAAFGGSGMLYIDPAFENPTAGDVRIKMKSAARESGDNSALDLDGDTTLDITQDVEGSPRLQGASGGIVDMGAYERCFADIDNNGLVNFFDYAAYVDLYNSGNPDADIYPPGGDGALNFFDINIGWTGIYNGGAQCN